jgi:PAS domain S-box-containing protein
LNRRLLGYFTALFLPSAALLIAAAAIAYQSQARHQVDAVKLRQQMDSSRGVQTLGTYIEDFTRDVLFVRAMPATRQATRQPPGSPLTELENLFASAAETKRDVDQVRWIDETGMERARVDTVNGRPVVRTLAELQDKGSRYYFRAISALTPGDVYISPLDLNVERGTIELPYKPTLRIGAPLFDAAGTRRGMLVLNYRAHTMLEALDESTRGLYGQTTLLNSAGFSLQGGHGLDDWGFMFGKETTFATQHPGVWRQIQSAGTGQFVDASGLWTFATIQPQAIVTRTAAAVGSGPAAVAPPVADGAENWILVSHVSAAQLGQMVQPLLRTFIGTTVLLLMLSFLLTALGARAWQRGVDARLDEVQRQARESAKSLRLVLQSNPNAMLIVDRNGAITESNPRAEQVFDCSGSALRTMSVEDLVPAGARAGHAGHRAAYFAASLARPMGAGLDLTARRRDGSEFPVEISLAPLTLRGEPYVVATVVDISARKQAENMVRDANANLERRVEERTQELRSAEADLRLLLESSASGLYGVDSTGRVSFVNPAACRILGAEADAIVGRLASEFVADDGRAAEEARSYVERTLRDGQSFSADDASFRHAGGGTVPVMFSTHPMVRDGVIVGAVVSFTDMTERRRMDQAREVALHEAERLARARSDFLANMSHEIRTPLNGVLGLAQVGYRDQRDNRGAREAFAQILESGRTLLGIVDNVLDFSRIEAGKIHVDSIPVRLADLLEEVSVSISPVATEKRIGLRIVREPHCPELCMSDPMRIKQVLLNLLANAVKFTQRGEVVLTAGRVGDTLRFTVRDTGIGISDEQAARIFSAFEQADSSTTRRFGGTGLGLAISRRITELMQGTIEVRSRLGQGSEFIVTLPFVQPPPEATAPVAHDIGASGTRRVERLQGLRILLAEDNEVNQMVVQAMLNTEGPQVVTVSDGAQAVAAVRREGPDAFNVVLMDIQMPGMDGYEATRLIHEFAPDLPVIGQTAHVLQEAIEHCRAAGMVAHLAKPIDRHELIITIMRHARIDPDQG